MSRKMYVMVTTRLIINADDDKTINEIMEDIDVEFNSGDGYDVVDSEMRDFELIDSK